MQILVIGAGLAGLTCARTLHRDGHHVEVLEASDNVGGRVRSDFVHGYTLDRGFQVLFDAYPAARRQLHYPELRLRYFDPGAILCFNGQRSVLTDPLRDRNPVAILGAVASFAVTPLDKALVLQLALELKGQTVDEVLAGADDSTMHYLHQRGFSRMMIERFFQPFYGGIFLDRSLNTSAKCFKFDFKMAADGGVCVPAGGMGEISHQLARELREFGRVHCHQPVAALLAEGERVVGVRLEDGSERRAEAVVLAAPAPEAARLCATINQHVPTLPTGQVGTVTLYFSGTERLYNGKKLLLNAAPDAFVNNAQLLSNIAPEYAQPHHHLLSASVLGVPTLDDEELYRRTLADLRLMFAGDKRALTALATYQPLALYRIPYGQFAQPPGLHPGLPDNMSGRPGLFFAAEWTEASSLNAAMISGEKCAEAMMKYEI
ncbi:MAG: FAD-dependent oxidoreductase [Chloroflexaceae bacterium]|jgi:phytoene dehydrogenase-like protein|nr:FAD-dependent oxidoreductase [Chloroflexaceae bacterium]